MNLKDIWDQLSTPKKVVAGLIVCCIGLWIIGALSGTATQDQNTNVSFNITNDTGNATDISNDTLNTTDSNDTLDSNDTDVSDESLDLVKQLVFVNN